MPTPTKATKDKEMPKTPAVEPKPTAKPAAEKTALPNPVVTDDNLTLLFQDRLAGRRKPAAKPVEAASAKDDKPKPEDKPKEEGKPAGTAPAALPPLPPLPTITAPALDVKEIAKAVGEGVVAAQKASTIRSEELELDDEDKANVIVLERMGKDNPTRFGRLAGEYKTRLEKLAQYQSGWVKEHPGGEFDPEADEHNVFFRDNDPDELLGSQDFTRTVARMEAEKVTEKLEEKHARELKKTEDKERLAEIGPKIAVRQIEAAKSYFKGLGDEFSAVLGEDGRINHAEIKKIVERDPTRAPAFAVAQQVEGFAQELYMLANGLREFSPNDVRHNAVFQFVNDEERLMQSLPQEQQVWQGKRFITAAEFEKLPESHKPYYWHYTEADLTRIYGERMAEQAKTLIAAKEKEFETMASTRGYVKTDKPAGDGKPPEKPAPPDKPTAPAGIVEQRIAPLSSRGVPEKNTRVGTFLSRFSGQG
jgi:uncharacterized protein YciI